MRDQTESQPLPGTRAPPLRTLAGLLTRGFFVILPVLLAGLVLEKIHLVLRSVLTPVLEALPGTVFQHRFIQGLLLLLAVAAVLMLLGFMARTRFGTACGRLLHRRLLRHLPFYESVRRLNDGLQGKFEGDSFKPVLVTMNPGMQQFGVIVERHPGGVCTVFLPSAPNPGSGTVALVEAALLREVPVPMHKVFRCQSQWGHGAWAVANAANPATPSADGNKTSPTEHVRTPSGGQSL